MNLELSLLRSFIAIAEHGSFLAAADVVARSPAAVSMQIKKLETEIGHPLFKRDARETKLTPYGEKLLPYAKRMLLLESELKTEFSTTPLQGSVDLGVPDDVVERFPMKVLSAFMDEYPNIKLGIHVDHTPALLKKVDSGKLALSIITYAPSIPSVTECERLTREPEVWAMAANGIAAEKSPLPITLWDKGWAWHEPIIKTLQDADIEYSIILECENITGRKSAIEADLAVGPVPISQLNDRLKVVSHLQRLPPLPEYGLGLKVEKEPEPEVVAVANHLRQHFNQFQSMATWTESTSRS
ncbi:MAG: LysR family transcriptional regulator [Pseudomonadota bacterium]